MDFARCPIVKSGVTKPALRLSCKRAARGHGGARQRAHRPETHNNQTITTMIPSTIREALVITKGYFITVDGAVRADGLEYFGSGVTCDDGRNGLDCRIGEELAGQIAEWNPHNDAIEMRHS